MPSSASSKRPAPAQRHMISPQQQHHHGSLLTLYEDLNELVLWHCDLPASSALASVSQELRRRVRAKCFSSDEWLAMRVPLRLLLPRACVSDHVCLRRLGRHEDATDVLDPRTTCGGEGRSHLLHVALEHRPHATELLLGLLRANPRVAMVRCADYAMLPIEHAAERGASDDVMHALLEVHGQLGGGIPSNPLLQPLSALHLAVINGAGSTLLRALLRASPASAAAWACENGHDDEYTDLLPLHLAAAYGPRSGSRAARVVHALCASYPRAAATREGRHGMMPLHIAALSSARVETLHALVQHFPLALGLKDDRGRTPLDCARLSAAALAAGSLAVEAMPPGYTHREYAGLNPHTPERHAYRQSTEHASAVVECLEVLTLEHAGRLDGGPSWWVDEGQDDARTWRYVYHAEGHYGEVVQGCEASSACPSP